MRLSFETNCSAKEYAEQGKRFDFPKLIRCPNGRCKSKKVEKHGFYERNL